jgi:sterol desaturase/sphingolipid hydroxylase (fatty acid hydroxylase superfamily)
MISQVNLMSIVILIAFFFVWAIVEYSLHRFVLHGLVFSFLKFKVEHSVFHHGYFNDQNMSVVTPVDTNRVLLFPLDLISVLLINFMLSYLLSIFFGQETALLFCVAGVFYSIAYECLHAICHSNLAEKFPVLESIAQHHRVHHDPLRMSTVNFAVVLPVIDKWFGTSSKLSPQEASHV